MKRLECLLVTVIITVSLCIVTGNTLTEKHKKVRCVTYNWDVYMRCEWNVPNGFQLNVRWQIISDPVVYKCPYLTPSSCVWNLTQGDVDMYKTLNITTVFVGDLRNITYHTRVAIPNIVKPAPVSNLLGIPSLPNCINLSWRYNINFESKTFRIRYYSARNNEIKTEYIEVVDSGELTLEEVKIIKHEVCNLTYFTWYNVMVDCHPEKDGYWSDVRVLKIITNKSVPDSPPVLPSGSFTLSPVSATNVSSLTVYWQHPAKELWNDDRIYYEVTLVADTRCKLDNVTLERITPFLIYKIYSFCSYSVYVWSRNSIGISRRHSFLYVRKYNSELFRPKDVILDANLTSQTTVISWSAPSSVPAISYTVYWCLKTSGLTCMEGISFKQVAPHKRRARINMPGFPVTSYVFGVSLEISNSLSSGFRWSTCSENAIDDLVPYGITFESLFPEDKVKVLWQISTCTDKLLRDRSIYTVVRICNTDQCTAYDEEIIWVNQTHLIIDNVMPQQSVCVKVLVFNDDRLLGESDVSCFLQPKEHMILKVVLSLSVFAFVISIAVLTCCICRIRHFCRKPYDIDIPRLPRNHGVGDRGDSGKRMLQDEVL